MKAILAAIAGIMILVTLLWSQIAGGIDAIRARARADEAMRQAYVSQPGGASEENLFEVLILMGAGDQQPSEWNGTVAIGGGDIESIDGYRFQLPDRVLPQGGWRMKTNPDRILASSPIEGTGVSATVVMPKGLLISGRGSESANLTIATNNGNCTVAPMQLVAGAPRACGSRVLAMRLPNATDLSGTELRDFTTSAPQRIRVVAKGTDTIEAIHLIRDAQYIYKWSPNSRHADFQFSDPAAGRGQHWYYVRVEQKNGELAWSSPIWVKY